MRQSLTTMFGVASIILAIVGLLLMALPAPAKRPSIDQNNSTATDTMQTMAVAAKVGLLAGGLAMLARSRLAIPILMVALIISMIHTVMLADVLTEPPPAGLTPAAQSARKAGGWIGWLLPPIWYLGLIFYLSLPSTREEFGGGGMPKT